MFGCHPRRGEGMGRSPETIRNVALVGHRGSGKTSLHEALLFEAGVLTRLGSVVDGSTASDTESDEQARQMSISMTLSSFEWAERKINLLATPGDPSGAEQDCNGVIDLVDMRAYRYEGSGRANATEIDIPDAERARAEEYREKLLDEVAEVSDELMERSLEGAEI